MKEKFIGCMLVVMLLSACNSRKADSDAYLAEEVLADSLSREESAEEAPMVNESVDEELQLPENADMLFDDFVFVFVQSRKVQLDRVRFPFPVINGNDTTWLRRENWHHETLYLNSDEYTVFFNNESQMDLEKGTELTHVDVEHLLLKEKCLDTYHFKRIKGKWWMMAKTRQPLSAVCLSIPGRLKSLYCPAIRPYPFLPAAILRCLSVWSMPTGRVFTAPEHNGCKP